MDMEDIIEQVRSYIAVMENIDVNIISADSHLVADIGMTSIDIIEMMCNLGSEYELPLENDVELSLSTVGSVAEYIYMKAPANISMGN